MQRTVRVLRIALPILIAGFILILVLSWNRNTAVRAKPDDRPVTSSQRPQDKGIVEGMTFEDVQTIGGRVVSRIRARRVVSFESGWSTLEEAYLTVYRANGLTYEVFCPQAQFNADTKEADAKGGVRVSSSDGIEVRTAEIRFDGSRLTNDVAVDFRIDRWTGKAGALDLDVAGETLRLHKNVTAVMTPASPAETPMTLRGEQSVFHRRENTVTFEKSVEMVRGPESVRTDMVIGRFTHDRKQLVGMEGNGPNTTIVMAGSTGPGEDLGGRKEITCDGFFTEVGPAGEITAINARSADKPARAILEGPPKRDITARGFRVALANRAVTEIRADLQVVMKELGEAPREIQAEHVTVYFDPNSRRARSAYLEGGFKYSDPKTTATAFRANYDIAGDRIVLTTDPGWQATVVSDGHILKAKQIEFSPKGQTARATGSVIAQLAQKGKGTVSADATALFPSGKPVFVNSDELLMRQANRTAVFTGNVKAWQEKNTILTAELQVQGAGDGVVARGGVRTMLYNSADPQRRTPVQSTSEQLIARKTDKRIDLVGKVIIIDDARRLESEKASFFFSDAQKIQRIEAEQNVRVNDIPTARKGQGDRAVYNVEKKMIYLYGSPATVNDPSGNLTGQQFQFDLTRNKVQVVSPEGQTKGTYKHDG